MYANRLMKHYSLTDNQQDQISRNPVLFDQFAVIDSKIVNGIIKNVKNPTAYVARSLFAAKDLKGKK